jgi:hypothetical protein
MVFFDKPFSTIEYNRALRCAVHVCRGYFLREEYHLSMRQCLNVLHQTGATSLIINMQAVCSEESWDADWTGAEWFPRILLTDVRKIAIIVLPADLLRLRSRSAQIQVGEDLLYGRFFDTAEEAFRWIRFT